MIYLDNAATTPVNPQVAQTISESLMNDFGNPSSLYSIGAKSEMYEESDDLCQTKTNRIWQWI